MFVFSRCGQDHAPDHGIATTSSPDDNGHHASSHAGEISRHRGHSIVCEILAESVGFHAVCVKPAHRVIESDIAVKTQHNSSLLFPSCRLDVVLHVCSDIHATCPATDVSRVKSHLIVPILRTFVAAHTMLRCVMTWL